MNLNAQSVVRTQAPSFINESQNHASNCEKAATEVVGSGDELAKKILTNIYRKSSIELEFLSKVEYLERIGSGAMLHRATVDFGISDFVRKRLPSGLARMTKKGSSMPGDERMFSLRFGVRQLQKIIANKLFRYIALFGRAIIGGKRDASVKSIVRTWVDVSFELYEREMAVGLVYVLPFGINIRRQAQYIRRLKRKKISFQFDGYDYSVRLFLKWLLSRKDIDFANMELSAAKKYAESLMNRHPELNRVFTTDEFEPGSFYVCETLKDLNIRITNKAHGVGKYCPYVCYDEFYVFNRAQVDYYSRFSPLTSMKCYDSFNIDVHMENARTVVFIDQLIEPDGSAIHKAQLAAITLLKEIANEFDMRFIVKVHPNAKRIDRSYREWAWSGSAESIETPIFFTFFSTAYLTFEKIGRTYLIKDNVFDPAIIFGDDARIVHITQLREAIANAIDS